MVALAGGNPVRKVTVGYTYDVWNQLKSVQLGDKVIEYSYDAEGYRISKIIRPQGGNPIITKYLYDGDKVVLELNGDGTQAAWNVYGLSLILRKVDDVSVNYLYNGHGDVTSLINAYTGAMLAKYNYDALGNIDTSTTKYYDEL